MQGSKLSSWTDGILSRVRGSSLNITDGRTLCMLGGDNPPPEQFQEVIAITLPLSLSPFPMEGEKTLIFA